MGKVTTDKKKLATLAALFTCVIFGFSFMASRIAMQHTSPEMLLAIRFTVSVLIMTLLLITGLAHMDLKGKPLGKFLLMGLCQPVIYFFAETAGIQYTNSSFSGVMISLIPVLTAILSAVFLNEKIPLKTLGWILCSVAGVGVLSFSQTSAGVIQVKGIIWLVVAVLSASVFYLLSRSMADAFTPFERTFIMMLMGFIFFVAQAVVKEGPAFLPMLASGIRDIGVMGPTLYLSVLSSVLAFFLQNYAVNYLDLARITVFENIIPVISVAAGIIFLKEPFSAWQLTGIALILLGVWKVTTSHN